MRISHSTSGGIAYFPNLAQPTSINTDQLPPELNDKVTRLVESADFFALPKVVGGTATGADLPEHTITIKDGPKSHTVRFQEPIINPTLQDFVQEIQATVRANRTP